MNVFIVENSDYLLERIANRVQAISNARVSGQARTAREAIEKIRQTQPDLILLDIHLDQGTGYQVLEAVRARQNPPIVMVLTNYAYPQYRKKYLGGGANYFFDKSGELEQAMRVVRQIAEKKKWHAAAPLLHGSVDSGVNHRYD